jgi:hypothetical protein
MTLREKLRQLNQLTEDTNSGEALDTWRGAVGSLYAKIRLYLSEYERDGLVQSRRSCAVRNARGQPFRGDSGHI